MAKKEKTKLVKRGKGWFMFVKHLTKGRYKKPDFIYLGEKIDKGGIILSNHVGTDAPMSLELYLDAPIRMWGAHEMNSGLVKMYKYQTRVHYHEKKHWNLHLARLFCLLASPLTNMFYSGINLISTYRDNRFYKTLKESMTALKEGVVLVVIQKVQQLEQILLLSIEDIFNFNKLACFHINMYVVMNKAAFTTDNLQA